MGSSCSTPDTTSGRINPNWYDVVRPTQLPSFKNEFAPSGNVYASVRQTRFGVKSSTPTPYGDLNTIFEFELFGTGVDAGQTTFRLRHAYGELGQFGAGQTWSPFMDIGVFPNTVEYWGPNGMVFFRNVQVRWMPIRKKTGSVTIALERPGASGDQGVYADRIELSNIRPRFNFPDLSGNARIDRNWGYVQMAGIVRKIGWVDTSGNPVNLGASVVGWGVNANFQSQLVKKQCRKAGICLRLLALRITWTTHRWMLVSRTIRRTRASPSKVWLCRFLVSCRFSTTPGISTLPARSATRWLTSRTQTRRCQRTFTRVTTRSRTCCTTLFPGS